MASRDLQECSLDTEAFRQIREQLLSARHPRPRRAAAEEVNEGVGAAAASLEDEEEQRASRDPERQARVPQTRRVIITSAAAINKINNNDNSNKSSSRGAIAVNKTEYTRGTLGHDSASPTSPSELTAPTHGNHVHDARSIAAPPPSQDSLRQAKNNASSRHALNHRHRRASMEDVAAASVEPSDTQYIPSQVFTDFLTKTTFANPSRASNILPHGDVSYHADPQSYAPGDAGHVDFSLDTDTHAGYASAAGSGESEDELGISQSQSQDRDETVTSPAPLSPFTPAVAGQKRDRHGNAVAQSTPLAADSLAAMFKAPSAKFTMGLSQVFKQTQAATSPLVDGPKSDPIFERPSPDARALNGQSSQGSSSPVFVRQFDPQRPVSDPREMYVPMKASQEVRERQCRLQLQSTSASSHSSGDEDELGEDSEERRAEARRRKAEVEAAVRRELTEFVSSTAPSRLDTRTKTADAAAAAPPPPSTETPAPKSLDKGVIYISDDTPRVPDANSIAYEESDDESVNGYDELSQAGFTSSRRRSKEPESNNIHAETGARPTSSPLPAHAAREVNETRLTRSFQGGFQDEWDPDSGSLDGPVFSQSVKVADSQPDRDRAARPHGTFSTSVGSKNFVSQSQDLTMSTNIFTDLPPQSEIPESSSIPGDTRIPLTSASDNRDAPVSESPPSSPPPTADTSPPRSPIKKKDQSRPSGKEENPQTGQDQKEDAQLAAPMMRKPIRTIVDTSPASASHNRSSPDEPDGQDAIIAEAPSTGIAQHASTLTSEDKTSLEQSLSLNLFETAPTHGSTMSSRGAGPVDETANSPKATLIRKMKSIGPIPVVFEQPSPIEASFDILNEEDNDYEAAMAGNSQDRGVLSNRISISYSSRRALQEPAPEANVLPPRETSTAQGSRSNHQQPALNSDSESQPEKRSEPLAKGKLKRPTRKARKDRNKVSSQDIFSVSNSNSQPVAKSIVEEAGEDELETAVPPNDDYRDELAQGNQYPTELEPLSEAQSAVDGAEAGDPISTTGAEARDELDTRRIFPNRVLARFKDPKNYYYSATCVGRNEAHGSLMVRFDDDSVDKDVSPSFVRSLELRLGDVVKIDRENSRKNEYTIRELRNPLPATRIDDADNRPTDVYGHQTLLIALKQRESLITDNAQAATPAFEVDISELYLTSRMWPSFADRTYDYVSPPDAHERLNTPTDAFSRPGTPSSRSRRPKKAALHASLSIADSRPGLFSNMGFAITYDVGVKGRELEKESVSKLIAENGGRLLSGSFEELFDRQSWFPTDGNEVNLTLSSASAELGFTALIADKYSRRVKYIQALALNIPCLSGRWVIDSIASRTVLPWARYLLPAGESDLLGGSIRSRTFLKNAQAAEEASMSTLCNMFNGRAKLLSGANIIIVMGRQDKKARAEAKERRELHVLLSCALGARKVARVKDLAEARSLITQDDGHWDLLNVEDDAVDDAKAAVHGDELDATARARKKRRSGGGADTAQTVRSGVSANIKVIGEEFVVQSLIAGVLVDGL